MNPFQTLASPILNDAGLNCHAVFDIAALPSAVHTLLLERCPQAIKYRQLIIIGHGGKAFWQALKATGADLRPGEDAHPVDAYTVDAVEHFLRLECHCLEYEIVYPGSYTVSLQELGKMAGWHHSSPFMVGINAHFGSWFAYRAVLLANTDFPATQVVASASPCADCSAKPCVSSCPAKALEGEQFHLLKCVSYRQQADSVCKDTCIARTSCPVGEEHRYCEEQIRYHYGRSMRMIERYKKM
jgi:epoxyqueuosine reductase